MSGEEQITFCDKSIYETGFLTSKKFPPLKNDRILKAIRGEVPDKLPIWIMRQAGRYLPEFKKIREVPLIGFSGALWTLMGFMVVQKHYLKLKNGFMLKEQAHVLLTLLTDVIIDYLVMQVEAGGQILEVFDTRAEYLNKNLYKEYGLPCIKRICEDVKEKLKILNLKNVPVVLFAKGAWFCLEEQAVLGIDWTVNVEKLQRKPNITYQGNLDPCALYAPKADLEQYIKRYD
ncbi:hypothetical protein FQA39_LY07084 [Lamprigera yunnana]|nr:hypothetical protein FQA39_LY07084 [Lamprigera yunnana]